MLKMASNQGGRFRTIGVALSDKAKPDTKGGQQSQEALEAGSKQQSGGSQRGVRAIWPNDPERASEQHGS